MRKKLHSLVLTALLLIFSLQMMAAKLGEAGKRLAALAGVSNVEALKSSCFPEKNVFYIPGGSHKTRILSFPEPTRQEIIQLIKKWLAE